MNQLLNDDFAAIAPRISGSVSALSSAIIIIVIARSTSKLSIIYHRIMFMMSCADILSSIAMGLSTLPMPKDEGMRPGVVDAEWSGTRLGNINTCTAQGFFFQFGLICMYSYNCSLCTYYGCAVAFQLPERKIKKYIEPILHIIPLVSSFSVALVPIFFDAYNPTAFEAWCTFYFPERLTDYKYREIIHTVISYVIGFTLVLVFVMFSLIIWRVAKTQRILRSVPLPNTVPNDQNNIQQCDNEDEDVSYESSNIRNDENENTGRTISAREEEMLSRLKKSQKNTKVVIIQALAYFFAFLISLMCPLIRSFSLNTRRNATLLRLQVVLMPLQGFFNAVIFISHKFYNYYQAHQNMSTCHILSLIFFRGYQEPVVLSRISFVRYDQQQSRLDVRLEDEKKIELMSFDVSGSGLNVLLDDESSNGLSGFEDHFKGSINEGLSGFSNEVGRSRNSDVLSSTNLSYGKSSTT